MIIDLILELSIIDVQSRGILYNTVLAICQFDKQLIGW